MDLLLPTKAQLQSLSQSIGLLVLGSGFQSKSEFLLLAEQLKDALLRLKPFDLVGPGRRHEGRLVIIADPAIGKDVGLDGPASGSSTPLLRLRDDGDVLEAYLNAKPLPPLFSFPNLGAVWRPVPVGGAAAKLIIILRKPPTLNAPRAELYRLPVVAVDATIGDEGWIALALRALAQLVGGLADEFTRSGSDWSAPPASWFVSPLDPSEPADVPERLGPNVVLIPPGNRGELGLKNIAKIAPGVSQHWLERQSQVTATPFRVGPGQPFIADSPSATIRLELGGGGFRSGTVRCAGHCIMREAPLSDGWPDIDGDRVGTTPIGLCAVCYRVISRAIGEGLTVHGPRRQLHNQRSQFDESKGDWKLTALPVTATGAPAATHSVTVDRGAEWSCSVAVTPGEGLKITALKLKSRPGDPLAACEDIAESISFTDLSYETKAGLHSLVVADALSNAARPPRLELGTSSTGKNRLGIKLTLAWSTTEGLLLRAEMSLVCRTIRSDFDPGGAAEACKFFPELVLSWSREEPKAPQVRRLNGTVVIVANNRIPAAVGHGGHGHHGGHGSMPVDKQSAVLITDSNSSKRDAEYDIHYATLLLPLPPVPVPVAATWLRGRLLGNLDSPPGVGAYLYWKMGPNELLPEWSWLFDYALPLEVTDPEVEEVVVWDNYSQETRGVLTRPHTLPWPPAPDPGLGSIPKMEVVKLPRQGAFDNLHVNTDMGLDSLGRPIIAAPFCADLCLHLHVRWGTHAAEPAKELANFLGWSSGHHPAANSTLGAPLVPPNQRITLGAQRLDAMRTRIRYVAAVMWPEEARKQVVLEQGLGFAFTYNGLKMHERGLLSGPYMLRGSVSLSTVQGFIAGNDPDVRAFFHHIYECIRWYSYGYSGTPPQQIPGFTLGSALYRTLIDL